MEAAAEEDASLTADRAFFRQLSADLKETIPAERTPPFADFFNSHLQKRIRDLQEEAESAAKQRPSWWPNWFRLSWAAPLAAATVVVLTLMQIGVIGGRSGSQIVYAYTPDDSVTARTEFDRETNAMIVRLEGMEPLPDGFDLLLADADDAEPPFLVESPAPSQETFVFVGPQPQYPSDRPY